MKILVIGSGGREHALCWKFLKSPRVSAVYCAPGNAGTATIAQNVPIAVDDLAGLVDFAAREKIDLTFVGPEAPLCAGIVDLFESKGLAVFGPNASAARLEGSKVFTKDILLRYGIPTAQAGSFTVAAEAKAFSASLGYPQVVKADGLAAGKGVIIAPDALTAESAIEDILDKKVFGAACGAVVVEEFLEGEEASLHLLVSGSDYAVLPSSQDHKRIGNGDTGPNTGGMGAYSPAPVLDAAAVKTAEETIVKPLLAAFEKEGIHYKGILYGGLMVGPKGIQVLEFNCRFGDPETQVLMPQLDNDLVDLCEAVIGGSLGSVQVKLAAGAAACVVMAAGGYPGDYAKGTPIAGDLGDQPDSMVFHAGTTMAGEQLVTAGGRVLGVTAWGADIRAAIDAAYRRVGGVSFSGAQFRTDIAARALSR